MKFQFGISHLLVGTAVISIVLAALTVYWRLSAQPREGGRQPTIAVKKQRFSSIRRIVLELEFRNGDKETYWDYEPFGTLDVVSIKNRDDGEVLRLADHDNQPWGPIDTALWPIPRVVHEHYKRLLSLAYERVDVESLAWYDMSGDSPGPRAPAERCQAIVPLDEEPRRCLPDPRAANQLPVPPRVVVYKETLGGAVPHPQIVFWVIYCSGEETYFHDFEPFGTLDKVRVFPRCRGSRQAVAFGAPDDPWNPPPRGYSPPEEACEQFKRLRGIVTKNVDVGALPWLGTAGCSAPRVPAKKTVAVVPLDNKFQRPFATQRVAERNLAELPD